MTNQVVKFPIKDSQVDSQNGITVTTYYIGTNTRGSSDHVKIALDHTKEYLEFIYDDGTTWFSDSETIHELFPEIKNANRDADSAFEIPIYLETSGENRGIFGQLILKVIKVFTKPLVARLVKDIATDLENKHLNSREGLNRLNSNFELVDFDPKKSAADKPYLLFIHGTNSDTLGAFSALQTNDTFSKMVSTYGDNILAFQHRTLTESPLSNAVALANSLPNNSTLHIVSHSRGGLVGDILSKYSANRGFTKDDCNLLEKDDRTGDVEQIQKLNEIFNLKKITVQKFVRVASPSAGTLLASDRIDHLINVLFNLLGDKVSIIADITHELISAVLNSKNDIKTLPGLEAMHPESPFIKVLNNKGAESEIDASP